MNQIRLLLLAVCIAYPSSHGFGGEPEPQEDEELSPGGTFKAVVREHQVANGDRQFEVLLESIDKTFKSQLLADYQIYVPELLITRDDRFIAINHKQGSNASELSLFSLGEEGLFHAVESDYEIRVIQRIKAHLKLSDKAEPGNGYWVADMWLRDGVLLAHFGGRWDEPGGNQGVSRWYFIYDVKADEVSWDLESSNLPGITVNRRIE